MPSDKNPYELFLIWCVIIILAIIICGLGIWGFAIAYNQAIPTSIGSISGAMTGNTSGLSRNTSNYFLDFVYASLQLFVLQSGAQVTVNNWQLEMARFLAPVLTLSSLFIIFWTLFDRLRIVRLFINPGHVVICGCGYLGPAIARHYIRKEKRLVVIIEKDPTNSALDECRKYGAMVIIGNATNEEILSQVRIFLTSEIFLVTGDDDANAEIAVLCEKIVSEPRTRLDQLFIKIVNVLKVFGIYRQLSTPRCHIHFEDALLSKTFSLSHPILKDGNNPLKMEFFNLYRIAGYCVQKIDPPPFSQTEIQMGIHPHLMIIGFGRMGENLVVQAAKRWKAEKCEGMLIITAVDRNARKRLEELLTWYPSLCKYCTITTFDEDVNTLGLLEFQVIFQKLQVPLTRIYICTDNSSKAVSIALLLIEKMEIQKIPVIVRSLYQDGVTHVIQSFKKQGSYRNIYPFPIIGSPCCMKFITGGMREALGKIIHEEYIRRQEREALYEQQEEKVNPGKKSEIIPDHALLPWSELDEFLKEASRLQADDIRKKLNAIGYDIAPLSDWDSDPLSFTEIEIEYLARLEHERWMKMKVEAGYVLGNERSDTTSPWLIPFEQLPPIEQEKDRIIIRNIPFLLERVDLRIVRNSVLFRFDLAKRIHENYIEQNKKSAVNPSDLALKPWDQLEDSLKQSNIDQADDIFNKISSIGFDVIYTGNTDRSIFSFSDEEIDILASQEHDRWMIERINGGWVYGKDKDIVKKVSPYLVPFNKLSEDDKEKDRQPVKEIPRLLATVGLRVIRKKIVLP